MIVRLTAAQSRAVWRVATDIVSLYWETELAKETVDSWDVVMPAIGWRRVLERIEERITGPRGGIKQGVAKALINARRRIAKELATMEAHPALRGVAVAEHSTVVIPVWHIPTGGHTIYPVPGQRMQLLWPERQKWSGMMVTAWHLAPPVGGGLADETVHLAFVHEVAAEQPGQV